jgi:hypothetical protein
MEEEEWNRSAMAATEAVPAEAPHPHLVIGIEIGNATGTVTTTGIESVTSETVTIAGANTLPQGHPTEEEEGLAEVTVAVVEVRPGTMAVDFMAIAEDLQDQMGPVV